MSEKIARYLSIFLGPLWLPVLFVLIILKSGLSGQQLVITFPSVLTLDVVIPILYLIIAPKLGWVGKWDMESKEERGPFLGLMLVLSIVTLLIIHFFGNTFLFNLNIIYISFLVIIFGITNYWKISFHTSLDTASVILINFIFDWKLPLLYLTIPIIFWARWKLKKHTIG